MAFCDLFQGLDVLMAQAQTLFFFVGLWEINIETKSLTLPKKNIETKSLTQKNIETKFFPKKKKYWDQVG